MLKASRTQLFIPTSCCFATSSTSARVHIGVGSSALTTRRGTFVPGGSGEGECPGFDGFDGCEGECPAYEGVCCSGRASGAVLVSAFIAARNEPRSSRASG